MECGDGIYSQTKELEAGALQRRHMRAKRHRLGDIANWRCAAASAFHRHRAIVDRAAQNRLGAFDTFGADLAAFECRGATGPPSRRQIRYRFRKINERLVNIHNRLRPKPVPENNRVVYTPRGIKFATTWITTRLSTAE